MHGDEEVDIFLLGYSVAFLEAAQVTARTQLVVPPSNFDTLVLSKGDACGGLLPCEPT